MHERLWFGLRLVWLLTLGALAVSATAEEVPPKVEIRLASPTTKPGADVRGTISVSFGPDLHAYQNPPSEDWMIPLKVVASSGTTIKSVTYPKGTSAKVGGLDAPALVYSGTIKIGVTFVAPNKPGSSEVPLEVHYQQCDSQNCFPPSKVAASARLIVQAAAPTPPPAVRTTPTPPVNPPVGNGPPAATKVDSQVPPGTGPGWPAPARPPVGKTEAPPVQSTKPGPPPTVDPRSPAPVHPVASTQAPPAEQSSGLSKLLLDSFRTHNYVLLIGLLLLVGLAINLTPCVYPMIPITVTFFSNQAGENRGTRLGLGVMYMLGIAVTYGLVGGVAAGAGATFGVLFTQRWFLFALAALMFALALPMFDVYQIGLPPAISKQLKGRSGVIGALIMGLFVGVAAAPCAGPLIVAIFAEVAKLKSVGLGVLVFGMVGVGLGLPYLVLAAASAGAAKSLPKAGGWMKTVKAILGLVVIGVGLNYLLQALPAGYQTAYTVHTWIAFYVLGALFLLFGDRSGETKLIFGIKGLTLLAFGILAGMGLQQIAAPGGADRIAWKPFTKESWEQAQASGKPILIDATANWCAECKTIEANVFSHPDAVKAAKNVVALTIDWSTGVDADYIAYTKELFDIKGLPHVVVTMPGGAVSSVHNHLGSPSELVESLKKAGAME